MDEVKRLRGEIDRIDESIVRLVKERYERAKSLGRVKKTRGLALRDPRREKQILRSVRDMTGKMSLPQEPVRRLFLQIFNMAVQAQKSTPHDKRELAGLRVLVAGTGGMGRLFANLAAGHGASVKVLGRTLSNTRRAAEEIGVQPGNFSSARSSDLVIVAVPTKATSKVSVRLGSTMKPGSMLADLSSVKTHIADDVAGKTREIEYVSLHPLFGPDTPYLRGQHIAAIPFRTGPKWKRLLRLFDNEGAEVHLTTVDAHDRTMALIQGVHHFGLICLGIAEAERNREYSTRSLQVTEELIQRLLDNWNTVMDIQTLNPFAAQGREEFQNIVDKMIGIGRADSKVALAALDTVARTYRSGHASNK